MNDIPDFAEALSQFRTYLAEQGNPDEVFWVFREDVWQISPTEVRVKHPTSSESVSLAQTVFAQGRERGLIEITAIATVEGRVAATVWFPKYPNEEVQGWSEGMKLSILQPLPAAKSTSRLRWWLLGFQPRFRHHQRTAYFIGTKRWASA